MKYSLGLSILSGLIIGCILGAIFFIVPAKFLICGPIPITSIWLSTEFQKFILIQTLYYGVIPGLIIGFIGGFNTDSILPRGYFSKGISVWCFIICTILAWVTQWQYLAHTPSKRIVLIVLMTIAMFLSIIPISRAVSFIEKIRKRRKS